MEWKHSRPIHLPEEPKFPWGEATLHQKTCESNFIDGFQQAGAEVLMEFYRGIDDYFTNFVFGHGIWGIWIVEDGVVNGAGV